MSDLRSLAAALALTGLLAACGDGSGSTADRPPPQAITDAAVGHFCGMGLLDHAGPKGQALLRSGGAPVWFSSVRDAFAFTRLPEEPKDIAALYVTDLDRAGDARPPATAAWVEMRDAWYVVGSGGQGGMGGSELFPFGSRDGAEAYRRSHGGTVLRFAEVPDDAVFAYASADPAPPPAAPPATAR